MVQNADEVQVAETYRTNYESTARTEPPTTLVVLMTLSKCTSDRRLFLFRATPRHHD
jgi:hypothetical protein